MRREREEPSQVPELPLRALPEGRDEAGPRADAGGEGGQVRTAVRFLRILYQLNSSSCLPYRFRKFFQKRALMAKSPTDSPSANPLLASVAAASRRQRRRQQQQQQQEQKRRNR